MKLSVGDIAILLGCVIIGVVLLYLFDVVEMHYGKVIGKIAFPIAACRRS